MINIRPIFDIDKKNRLPWQCLCVCLSVFLFFSSSLCESALSFEYKSSHLFNEFRWVFFSLFDSLSFALALLFWRHQSTSNKAVLCVHTFIMPSWRWQIPFSPFVFVAYYFLVRNCCVRARSWARCTNSLLV